MIWVEGRSVHIFWIQKPLADLEKPPNVQGAAVPCGHYERARVTEDKLQGQNKCQDTAFEGCKSKFSGKGQFEMNSGTDKDQKEQSQFCCISSIMHIVCAPQYKHIKTVATQMDQRFFHLLLPHAADAVSSRRVSPVDRWVRWSGRGRGRAEDDGASTSKDAKNIFSCASSSSTPHPCQ